MAEIRIAFAEEERVLAGQFGQFLQLFEQVVGAVGDVRVPGRLKIMLLDEYLFKYTLQDRVKIDEDFEDIWNYLPGEAVRYRMTAMFGAGLPLVKISKESPIEIITEAVPIAVTIAAIISGGRVKLPGLEVRLPPLGTGIASLRDALGLAGPRSKSPRRISERMDL